jgi:hypothetical protein
MRNQHHARSSVIDDGHRAFRLAYRGRVMPHASIKLPMSGSIARCASMGMIVAHAYVIMDWRSALRIEMIKLGRIKNAGIMPAMYIRASKWR